MLGKSEGMIQVYKPFYDNIIVLFSYLSFLLEGERKGVILTILAYEIKIFLVYISRLYNRVDLIE